MHIHIILYTQRAACLVLFAVCQRSSFAVSRSEHKNASGDSTPVASRKRVQRYGVFIYWPNLSATFLKVFWKKRKTGRKTEVFALRWDKKMKDAIERVQKPNLFELCRAWASSAKPTMNKWKMKSCPSTVNSFIFSSRDSYTPHSRYLRFFTFHLSLFTSPSGEFLILNVCHDEIEHAVFDGIDTPEEVPNGILAQHATFEVLRQEP